jgi:UTP--glucose-1-phosphate uridylyltransferase
VHVRKAVITAAGPDQRQLPLQTLVDRDGAAKSALRILLDEAARAGIEEIGVVVHPADRERYAAAAGDPGPRLAFVAQGEARGYAHALACARDFVGSEPFLHFVGDHLWIAQGERGAAQELVAVAEAESAAVSAVQSTREAQLKLYGAVGGIRVSGHADLYQVDAVLEKPTPTDAEQQLFVPGLRAGHYLCFFGMHVLPASIFKHIDLELASAAPARPSLSGALARMLGKERWLACEVNARRFNLGEKYGLLTAQLALALAGKDRDEVLTQLTDLLAQRGRPR